MNEEFNPVRLEERINSGLEDYLLQLIQSSTFDIEARGQIEREVLGGILYLEANLLLEQLLQNQLDPIESGGNYTQTDITKKLNKENHTIVVEGEERGEGLNDKYDRTEEDEEIKR